MASLNRLGILFNFIAGFLLAPQLIPDDRMRAIEEWAKQHLVTATKRQRRRTAKIRARWAAGLPFKKPLAQVLIWGAVATVGFVISGVYDQLWGASIAVVAVVAAGLGVMVVIVAVGTMLIAVLAAWRLANAGLAKVLSFARTQSGEGLLGTVGITFFVAGNALQLAATFG